MVICVKNVREGEAVSKVPTREEVKKLLNTVEWSKEYEYKMGVIANALVKAYAEGRLVEAYCVEHCEYYVGCNLTDSERADCCPLNKVGEQEVKP